LDYIKINIERLDHLLKLYGLTKEEVLFQINKGLKKLYKESEIFKTEIKISLLKKIDSIFNKGLSYYIDPKVLKESKEESIFFRKDKFNADLNLGSKLIVNKFEEEKITFSALAKLSDLNIHRLLPLYTINNDPKTVAIDVRKYLYPNFNCKKKEFLKSIINKFAEYNILVFEFVENWNKIEKANINGFYLEPNVIVLKRNQTSFSREIFTLIHELGHYLLNVEEIDDKINEDSIDYHSLSEVEKWCNDFAYYFLVGDYDNTISKLENASFENDYHQEVITSISKDTNLSVIAIYTRLLINKKIGINNYKNVVDEIKESIRLRLEREKLERDIANEKAKSEGRKPRGASPKPIQSPLYIEAIQSAYFEGVINEAEFCSRLNIKKDRIEKYLK
jgi:Zn-dependent peptidase ImmA (M78 family)